MFVWKAVGPVGPVEPVVEARRFLIQIVMLASIPIYPQFCGLSFPESEDIRRSILDYSVTVRSWKSGLERVPHLALFSTHNLE